MVFVLSGKYMRDANRMMYTRIILYIYRNYSFPSILVNQNLIFSFKVGTHKFHATKLVILYLVNYQI